MTTSLKLAICAFLVAAVVMLGSAVAQQPEPGYDVLPDSVLQRGVKMLVDRVGQEFFDGHIRYYDSFRFTHLGLDKWTIGWIVAFPRIGQEYSMPTVHIMSGDPGRPGILAVPPCAVDPSACEVAVDSAAAVTILERVIGEPIVGDPQWVRFEYNEIAQRVVWRIGANLTENEKWMHRAVEVTIDAVDGSAKARRLFESNLAYLFREGP